MTQANRHTEDPQSWREPADGTNLRLAIGPIQYFWPRARVEAFYDRLAERDGLVIYLGETVCSKRRELNRDDWLALGRELRQAGHEVVVSTLSLIEAGSELGACRRWVENGEFTVEANDMSAVYYLTERKLPFVAGPGINLYNHLAVDYLRRLGMFRMVLPVELGGPEFSHVQKGTIFAWWAGVQSLLPMFTGGLADRYGHKNTIAVAILLKIAGYGLMAHMMSYGGFFSGCMLLAAGTAIFKPGVQGTLAASLHASNASVGWGIFYQLVNVGGFLGPVLAGVLRLMDWSYVFWACAAIVAVNFLWLPFYRDATQDGEAGFDAAETAAGWGRLSRVISLRAVRFWVVAVTLLAAGLVAWRLTGAGVSWGGISAAAVFCATLWLYLARKPAYDAGRADPLSVFVVSVAGLFQHRVFFFCLVFSGFWLMFNQVFDLLPNVIDDWVDSSGIIATRPAPSAYRSTTACSSPAPATWSCSGIPRSMPACIAG